MNAVLRFVQFTAGMTGKRIQSRMFFIEMKYSLYRNTEKDSDSYRVPVVA